MLSRLCKLAATEFGSSRCVQQRWLEVDHAPARDGTSTDGDTATAAYWRFFESFNSRDPEQFSGALNYPHVRVSPRRASRLVPNAAAHAAAVSWDAVLATGWDHTEGHDPEILHLAADRAHIVGGWTRVNASGGNVLVNRVTYVVTRVPSGWGIQCRFGTDAGDAEQAGETSANHERAVAVVEGYIDAYNDRHWARCVNLVATPHFRVDVGALHEWKSREEMWAALRDGPWHFITPLSIHAAQGADDSVTVAFEGLVDGGQAVKGVFFVTRTGDEWTIAARSVMVE